MQPRVREAKQLYIVPPQQAAHVRQTVAPSCGRAAEIERESQRSRSLVSPGLDLGNDGDSRLSEGCLVNLG